VLNGQNSYLDLRKINAMHYRSLRIAARDFKRNLNRATLDMLGRARPSISNVALLFVPVKIQAINVVNSSVHN